jgi:hypothetical protein
MPTTPTRTIDDLSPRDFENFVFDILQAVGMEQVVWRTPGPDGGRDVEGIFRARDASGHIEAERWYVECKRYASSIDWPTIYAKIAYADSAKADFLLLVTNSNPSPQCETLIEDWNSNHRSLKVRVWRGYQLGQIVTQYAAVALKYGLRTFGEVSQSGFLPLASEAMKFAQAAYVAYGIGHDPSPALEAAAALSELLTLRMTDLETYGRIVTLTSGVMASSSYDWLVVSGDPQGADEISLRAITATLNYVVGSKCIEMACVGHKISLSAQSPRFPLGQSAMDVLRKVALWTNLELTFVDTSRIVIEFVVREG